MSPLKPLTSLGSRSDGSEYGVHMLDGEWWDAAESSLDAQPNLKPPREDLPAREPMMKPLQPRDGPVARKMSLREPSLIMEGVETRPSTLSPVFPVNGTENRFEVVPVTQKKQKSQLDPPSTGRRAAVADAFSKMTVTSPSKTDRGGMPQRLQSGSTTKNQPKKTVFLTVSDDEEDEVDDMLTGDDSPTSTQPSPLFSRPSTVTPCFSISRQGLDSWSSLEEGPPTLKRPRSSKSSEIETQIHSQIRPDSTDVFVVPRNVKSRKGNQEDIPTKPMLPQPSPLTFPLAKDTPLSVGSFFRGKLGTNLLPFCIAHSAKTQRLMDQLGLSWGVQYELARGVTLQQWDWDKVYNVLYEKPRALMGSNVDAAVKVRAVMEDRAVPRDASILLWEELDREQAAILENEGRGLGLMGEWQGQENWYGGRIQQVARLSKAADGRGYSVHLEAMEKRRSHRFARLCGSRRILQMRVPEKLIFEEGAQLKEFFQQKFILCGRVFVPFHAKDHSLYLVETNEDWEREPQEAFGDRYRRSFAEFINWHNPPEYNYKQALSKYVTRFALGLSTTVPALEFQEGNMFLIDDIYGNSYKGGSPSAEETMTDGCGLINQAALVAINVQLNRHSLPVALQGRIAGAKGVWLLHPTDESPGPKVWIRGSQNKIKYPYLDRSHRIFELVAPSHPSNPVSVSRQSIVNLSFNGVPDEVLLACVEKNLTEEIEPLLRWEHPHARLHLWNAINKNGNVSRSRLSRATAGISRALGLTRRVWKEDDDEEEVIDFDESKSAETGRNEYSGAPLGLHEAALELVQAGFHPSTFKPLRDKIQYIVQKTIESYVENFRIHLAESLEGFVVPDPLDVLEEGEIYYRSSQSLVNPRTQRDFHTLTGDVILGRYPIRLPSDMQKVTAVDKPELFPWPDVIIASTKGSRSLASLLSGGDMDGDELFMVREPELVEPFRNKAFVPGPPDLLEKNFQKHVETVTQFCERTGSLSLDKRQSAFQEALLLSLSGDRKGLYSGFHDHAVEKYGYDSHEAIRLAYMFNTLLDASKSGLILAEGIFQQDQNKFRRPSEEKDNNKDALLPKTVSFSTDKPSSDVYILSKLQSRAQEVGENFTKRILPGLSKSGERRDAQLTQPYETAIKFAHDSFTGSGLRIFEEDLSKIRQHVQAAFQEWSRVANSSNLEKNKQKKKKGSADPDRYKRAAMLFAAPIEGIIVTPNVEEIKASVAYYDRPQGSFAVSVAFRRLCEIKAKASKRGMVACTTDIDEMRTIPTSCIRALEKSYAG